MTTRLDLEHQFYDMLMESQFWSASDLRDYQHGQLSQLLRHAKANVPFYESRLDAVLKPNGDIDWDRWNEIPIIRRADLRDHRAAMQARQLPPGHGPTAEASSSGSTGLAITVTSPALMLVPHKALLWRCHRWNDVDWSQSMCTRQHPTEGEAMWPEGRYMGKWGPHWLDGPRGDVWMIYKGTSSEKTLEYVTRHGCRYFNNGPKNAHALGLDAERLGMPVQFDAVMAQGERVGQEDRDAIRRIFGARTIEHYSSKEGAQMAHPCPHGKLHVNAEAVLLEVLDDHNQPCAPGVAGRVVITPFYNTAQPLIRYEHGDLAIAGASCSCGRHLPVLEEVLGRTQAIFRHPDGRTEARLMPMPYREMLGCDFWQIAQVGPTNFEVRYIPVAGAIQDIEGFVRGFRHVYFDDAEVRLVEIDDLPLTPSGKFLEYINEYAARS